MTDIRPLFRIPFSQYVKEQGLTPAAMQTALADLELDELWVVYPGQRSYPLGNKISVRPLAECIAG